jgi:hypothetical protein
MKKCPRCGREYDLTMSYCLDDGSELLYGPASDEPATAILPAGIASEAATRAQIHTTAAEPQDSKSDVSEKRSFWGGRAAKPLIAVGIAVLLLVGGFFGYKYFSSGSSKQIESIAVMPFENRNSDADTDYLSDGLAESVIFRLTQIADLRVSPTSSVMRYKGKRLILRRSPPNLA